MTVTRLKPRIWQACGSIGGLRKKYMTKIEFVGRIHPLKAFGLFIVSTSYSMHLWSK
jgi:hypothetical protein